MVMIILVWHDTKSKFKRGLKMFLFQRYRSARAPGQVWLCREEEGRRGGGRLGWHAWREQCVYHKWLDCRAREHEQRRRCLAWPTQARQKPCRSSTCEVLVRGFFAPKTHSFIFEGFNFKINVWLLSW